SVLEQSQVIFGGRHCGNGYVHRITLAFARAAFAGVARSRIPGVLMQAVIEHRRVVVKNVLRAVAVVNVGIDEQDLFDPVGISRRGVGGGDGDVVVETESHGAPNSRVMSRRAAGDERSFGLAAADSFNGAANAAGGKSGRDLRIVRHHGVGVQRHMIVEGRLRTCLLHALDGAFTVAAQQLFIGGGARGDLDQVVPEVLVGRQSVECRAVTVGAFGVIARVVFQIFVRVNNRR